MYVIIHVSHWEFHVKEPRPCVCPQYDHYHAYTVLHTRTQTHKTVYAVDTKITSLSDQTRLGDPCVCVCVCVLASLFVFGFVMFSVRTATAIIHGAWTTVWPPPSPPSCVVAVGRSVRRGNPDRKIPVMNGKRRPQPRCIHIYTCIRVIYIYVMCTLTGGERWRRGETFRRMRKGKKKRFTLMYIV